MSEAVFYSLVSVLIVSALSLIGIAAMFLKLHRLKSALLCLVSFSAGALFGDAFIHLLPEAVESSGFGLNVALYTLSGIVVYFIVEKVVQWRHCHIPTSKQHPHPFAIMNLIGDSLHNFIDGLVIGASYLAGVQIGIATTIAVVFHEIPQEIGDFGVLLHGGFSRGRALMLNFLTALFAVLGAVVALALSSYAGDVTSFLVPFAAGGFIYIAGSDLIPELRKDTELKKSLVQLFFFVLGIAVMALLLLLE